MRKSTSIVLLATMALAAITAAAVPAGSQAPPERQTITLFDPRKTNYERFINEGREDLSPGDRILFVEKQFDPETCERVGKVTGHITIIKIKGRRNALFAGDFTVALAGGKIVAGAAATFTEFEGDNPVFAVTGGTEAYRDASGEVSFQESPDLCGKKGDLITIDIGPRK
jgi:hypothetical protein